MGHSRVAAAGFGAWVLVGLLACAGCSVSAPGAGTPAGAAGGAAAVELKHYAVAPQRVEDVRSVLQNVVGGGDHPSGSVGSLPDGQLVVVAPPAIQQGIASLLARLDAQAPTPPPPSIRLTTWAVVGRQAAEAVTPSQLGEIAPALDAIRQAQGPLEFVSVERLEVSVLAGQSADVQGRWIGLRAEPALVGEEVVARVKILARGGQIQTQLRLTPGQLVVLGQTGYAPHSPQEPFGTAQPADAGAEKIEATAFYILRAEVQR